MEDKPEEPIKGKHRRLYDESIVQNIMLATAYFIKDLFEENPGLTDEDVYEFIEDNGQGIIEDTLEEFHNQDDMLSEDKDNEFSEYSEWNPDDEED